MKSYTSTSSTSIKLASYARFGMGLCSQFPDRHHGASEVCDAAAAGGDLEVLKWLK
jgi:hypothetical protein